jgi:hypothetical protein
MANILFVVVENLRQYYGSPPLQESLLHLLCESARPNNGVHPTPRHAAFHDSWKGARMMPSVMLPSLAQAVILPNEYTE